MYVDSVSPILDTSSSVTDMFPFPWDCCFCLFLAYFGQAFMKNLSKFAATQTGSVSYSFIVLAKYPCQTPVLAQLLISLFNILICLDLYDVKSFFAVCMPFAFHYFKLVRLILIFS